MPTPKPPIPSLAYQGPLGAVVRFRADPMGTFAEAAAFDAPLVRMRLLHRTFYYVNDYEILTQIIKDWEVFQKSTGPTAPHLLGNGLVFAEGEAWRKQRRIIGPAFHRKALQSYERIMQQQIERVTDQWADRQAAGEAVSLTQGFYRYAIQVLRDALFGTQADAHQLQLVLDGVQDLTEYVIQRLRNPLLPPLWVPTPLNRHTRAIRREVDAAVVRAIEARHRSEDREITLIDMLLQGQDPKTGEGLPPHNIIEQVKIFLVAGTETSSNTLNFACYALARHPAQMQRLQAEIDAVLQGRPPTFTDFAQLPYLRAVVNETLRLYPPTWLNQRQATQPVTLAGRRFDQGTHFMFSLYQMQRDPRGWDEPHAFRPERWEGLHEDPPYYLPFSLGQRRCIGKQFALSQIYLMLATLVQRYGWQLPAQVSHQVYPRATLTLQPELQVQLQPRYVDVLRSGRR